MSWIEDINKLHLSIKTTLISLASLMPFWYISLYLFHKDFFAVNNIPLILSFCFCFSCLWYIYTVIITAIADDLLFPNEKNTDVLLIIGGITSIIVLSLIIALCYFFHAKFITFFLIAFGYNTFQIITLIIVVKKENKKLQEMHQESERDLAESALLAAELAAEEAAASSNIEYNKEAIFIFTRDRPETLSKTLDSIKTITYEKFIIDDSVGLINQQSVIELCEKYSNCNYLGKQEFNEFLTQKKLTFSRFSFLLRELGNVDWNLGYARNFALLFSKSLGLEKVLFMDDDIEVPDLDIIEKLFQLMSTYKFVGANITGLVDDSVLGHIATDVGITNERMLSGGFMVYNPNTITHYFLNNYNEDWIWLFLQLKNEKYLQTGDVLQAITNPFTNYDKKVMFQEFGEIVLDGILDIYPNGSYEEMLLSNSFWERILEERLEYMNTLYDKSTENKKTEYKKIIDYIKSNSKDFRPETFENLFKKYFSDRIVFQSMYDSLS